MRRAARISAWILASLVIVVVGVWVGLFRSPERISPPTSPLPASAAVAGAERSPFPKQTENHCGAYSLAQALRIVTGEPISGESLVRAVGHEVSWSERMTGTLPWRIPAEARRRGLFGASCTARAVEPARRLDCIRAQIATGRAVVVLLESEDGGQHYVLAVGYEAGTIDIYDPAWKAAPDDASRTIDGNGARPGNRAIAEGRFLEMWARGGIAGLYGWWYAPIGEGS